MRIDGRNETDIRPVTITRHFTKHAEGSVLIEMGDTKVICTASVEDKVPPFLEGKGVGWLTAEYSMLPRATATRNSRDISKLKLNGRSGEIQRLIGRSLRAAVDMKALGEKTITIDCDVIQADGGTRTASITGGYVALADAVSYMLQEGMISENPLKKQIAAISVGVVDGKPLCDLCYVEDSHAEVDMNVIMAGDELVEVQGTGENGTFDRKTLNQLLDLAEDGIKALMKAQSVALAGENE